MKSKISIPRMELKFYQLIRSVKYAFQLCYCCEEAKRRRQYLDEAFMLFSKYFNDFWL